METPIGYTTNFNFKKWAQGSNPGADELNTTLDLIDTSIKNNSIYTATAPIFITNKNATLATDTKNFTVTNNALTLIQDIRPTDNPMFNSVKGSYLKTYNTVEFLNPNDSINCALTLTNNQLNLNGTLQTTKPIVVETLKSSNFITGISGFNLNNQLLVPLGPSTETVSSLELDDLMVRGTFTANIFKKNIIKVSNGVLYIKDSATVSFVENGFLFIEIKDDNASFNIDDLLAIQINGNTNKVLQSIVVDATGVVISGVSYSMYTLSIQNGTITEITPGLTVINVKGGNIRLDSSSTYAPFINISDNVTSWSNFDSLDTTCLRLGKLDGIVGSTFGNLTGYGLYAKNNVYIEGVINAKAGGKLSNWNIDANGIVSDTVSLQTNTNFTGLNVNDTIKIGKFTSTSITASMIDKTEANIGYQNISNNISSTEWHLIGNAFLLWNQSQTPYFSTETDVNLTTWDFSIVRPTINKGLLLAQMIKVDFDVNFTSTNYNDNGGYFKVLANYYDSGNTLIYQQVIYSSTVADAGQRFTYKDVNGISTTLTGIEGTARIDFLFNFSGGAQTGAYNPLTMQLSWFKVYGYSGCQTQLNQDGLIIYHSPNNYLQFNQNNPTEINCSNITNNGLQLIRFHGKLAAAPIDNVKVGDMYLTTTGFVKFCTAVRLTASGIHTWVSLN